MVEGLVIGSEHALVTLAGAGYWQLEVDLSICAHPFLSFFPHYGGTGIDIEPSMMDPSVWVPAIAVPASPQCKQSGVLSCVLHTSRFRGLNSPTKMCCAGPVGDHWKPQKKDSHGGLA
ncbi:hypothetical protein HPB50_028986 [Hyalomma asiaticum]|nr:hypothetical protein HPB50_028986 [Hyalomma asiaticum]